MLFDKHDYPKLTGSDEDADWAACEAWEDHVYNIAESLSEDCWDRMVQSVRDLYDDYYRLY